MIRTRLVPFVLLVPMLALALGAVALAKAAQQVPKPSDTIPPGKNPHLGNADSLKGGLALYRVRCGDCHGLDARGYRGPDLTALLGGMPDERLFQTIRKGVPGTEMQRSTIPDDDVLMIIAYLRNMNAAAPADTPIGNAANGSQIFAAQCASCHRVGTAAAGSAPICRGSARRDRARR